MKKALEVLGGLVVSFVLLAISAICSGYVLSILWGWFIVSTFNLPQLSVAPAIGLVMVISYLTKPLPESKKKKKIAESKEEDASIKEEDASFVEEIFKGTMRVFLKASLALSIGYIVHLFM